MTKLLAEQAGHDDGEAIRARARAAERFAYETFPAERKVWCNEAAEQGLPYDILIDGRGYDVKSIPFGAGWINGGTRRPSCPVLVVTTLDDRLTLAGVVPVSRWYWGAPRDDWKPCWYVSVLSIQPIVDEEEPDEPTTRPDAAGAGVPDHDQPGHTPDEGHREPDGADLGAGAGWDDLW